MKILAVRIGNKYGPEYETYLEERLKGYDIIWIREQLRPDILLQWNKIYGMNINTDEPICVIDIDILLINDYKKIFNYPIKKGEFLAAPNWWVTPKRKDFNYTINGGFYKYFPKDCTYIYDKFLSDVNFWQNKYIANGVTSGPVNGEQYFIEDSVRERLKLITLPNSWFCRMVSDEKKELENLLFLNKTYKSVTGNSFMFLDKTFHSDIKFVHFNSSNNYPTKWKHFNSYSNKILPAQ